MFGEGTGFKYYSKTTQRNGVDSNLSLIGFTEETESSFVSCGFFSDVGIKFGVMSFKLVFFKSANLLRFCFAFVKLRSLSAFILCVLWKVCSTYIVTVGSICLSLLLLRCNTGQSGIDSKFLAVGTAIVSSSLFSYAYYYNLNRGRGFTHEVFAKILLLFQIEAACKMGYILRSADLSVVMLSFGLVKLTSCYFVALVPSGGTFLFVIKVIFDILSKNLIDSIV